MYLGFGTSKESDPVGYKETAGQVMSQGSRGNIGTLDPVGYERITG